VITILEVSWLHESGELFFSRRQPFKLDSGKITTTRRTPKRTPTVLRGARKCSRLLAVVGLISDPASLTLSTLRQRRAFLLLNALARNSEEPNLFDSDLGLQLVKE
jgi:hypothetical protein